jgi:DNA-directed RNA polymerase delta subunit
MAVTIHGKQYEEVKDRIAVFYDRYEDGRITTEILSEGDNHVTIRASIYVDQVEQLNNAPLATGIAREERGGEIPKYTENAETSAIGRAFANRNVYGDVATTSGTRPSAEEMSNVTEDPQQTENDFVASQANIPPAGTYKTGEVSSAEAFGEKPERLCPRCNVPMEQRMRRSDNKPFLGCPNYSDANIKCGETADV